MSWAGVNSENLASVWLLYHLTDKLDGEQVRALAKSLGLERGEGEDDKAYRARIQKAGVLPTRSRVDEALFLQARHELLAGIANERHPDDALALQSLLFGWGHGNEAKRVSREGPRTRAWKERALDNNWRHLKAMLEPCESQYDALSEALTDEEIPEPEDVPDLTVLLEGQEIRVACGAIPEGYVAPDADFLLAATGRAPEPDGDPILDEELDEDGEPIEEPEPRPVERPANIRPSPRGWFDRILRRQRGPELLPREDMLIDDRLHLATLEALGDAVERRELAMSLREEPPDLYDPEILYWHADFRVLLALRYVASLAEQYGVQTEIPPVLSMPLGATEITLEEATSVYGGLVGGAAWSFPGQAGARAVGETTSPALLIAEIRDVDGNVLYQARPKRTEIAREGTPQLTAHILRNVVRHGTGRRALAVVHAGRQVPVGGKTGTTNDFRNAAFLGFAPVWSGAGFRPEHGYAVGVYVGYDDNRPLVNERIRLAGASGALPAWIGTVDGLREAGLLGDPTVANVQLEEDEPEWPTQWPGSLTEIAVDGETGRTLEEPDLLALEADAPMVLVPQRVAAPPMDYRPIHRPPRIFPRTEDFEGDEEEIF